jgi:hypothetical protein
LTLSLKIQEICSLLNKAARLVDGEIKLDNGICVKVVKVMMDKDGVFLEVEEKVEDGLEHYEIMYQQDMVRL